MTASIACASWIVFPEVMVILAARSVQLLSLLCSHQWPVSDDSSLFHLKLKSQTSVAQCRFLLVQRWVSVNELQGGSDEYGDLKVHPSRISCSHPLYLPFSALPQIFALFILLTLCPLSVNLGRMNSRSQPDFPTSKGWSAFPSHRRKPA